MQKDYERLSSAEHIWIFGAGVYGHRAAELFNNIHQADKIDGVVVSSKDNNPLMVNQYTVHELGDIHTPNETSLFIIAVSERQSESIITALHDAEYYNYVVWSEELVRCIYCLTPHRFEDRRKNLNKVCLVLCGYKEFLWDRVFERLERFVPEDVEVCLLSSGLTCERLSAIAEKNQWSYLSMEENDITLIQNIALTIFTEAEWVFKMDEDIFLTENCFENLLRMYEKAEREIQYRVSFVAPLIPINGYGYIRILEWLGKLKQYEDKFGKAFYGCNPDSMLEKDTETAKYMWGMTGEIPQIDVLNTMISQNDNYSICCVRFSIGFILFKRSLWIDMKGFTVTGGQDLGKDEKDLCTFSILESKAIVVAENVVVGHFSFRNQTEGMKKFYAERSELFQIKEL